jgi:hypothetical protein
MLITDCLTKFGNNKAIIDVSIHDIHTHSFNDFKGKADAKIFTSTDFEINEAEQVNRYFLPFIHSVDYLPILNSKNSLT